MEKEELLQQSFVVINAYDTMIAKPIHRVKQTTKSSQTK